jgi:hypothetical protein
MITEHFRDHRDLLYIFVQGSGCTECRYRRVRLWDIQVRTPVSRNGCISSSRTNGRCDGRLFTRHSWYPRKELQGGAPEGTGQAELWQSPDIVVLGQAQHCEWVEAIEVGDAVRAEQVARGHAEISKGWKLALEDQARMERVPGAARFRAHEAMAGPGCSGPMAAATLES